MNESIGSMISLDQLAGVYPNSPLLLKTSAFDFQASQDGATIVISNREGVGVWDLATGKRIRLIEHSEIVIGVSLYPGGNELLTVATGKMTPARLWDVRTGNLLKQFQSPFDRDNQKSQIPVEDYGWNLWQHPDIWRFARSGVVPETGFGFTCGTFDPTKNRIATGCEDGRIIIWDAANAEPIKTLSTGIRRVHAIAFSADGTRFLAAGKDDKIQLWDLDDFEMVRQFDGTRKEEWVTGYRPAITFSGEGSIFAFYSPKERSILICDSISGDKLYQIPEASRLSSGYLDVSLRRGLAFIDESTLCSNSGGWIKIWDIRTGDLIQQHECQSGVNPGYAYPAIEFVDFLPLLDAFVTVEVENDENTGHEDWVSLSLRPRRLFEHVR